MISLDTPWPDIDDCHDASDNILRNADLLAPLRTLPIPDVKNCTAGFLNVTDETAAENVRLFIKQNGEWEHISSESRFNGRQLANGLELGIDARDVRRAGGWDGMATVQFTVQPSDGPPVTDSVTLRVAPVLVHHHAQHADRIFTAADSVGLGLPEFNDALRSAAQIAGIAEPVYGFSNYDKWVQDWFEPAYSSIPGPEGPIVLRIMLRSSQNRPSGGQIFTDLRTATVGAAQHTGPIGDTTDSMGNLETIPPHTYGGRSYPAGRAIIGSWNGRLPHIFNFLRAQEVQDPVELDTTWLMVGHVDEFVQFLPAPETERGWVMMVDDPLAGLNLLREASEAGHDSVQGLSRPRMATDPEGSCLPDITLSEVLNLANLTQLNEMAAERISFNVDILKKEIGLSDKDIFRVPAVFYDFTGWNCVASNTQVRKGSFSNKDKQPDIIDAAGSQPWDAGMLRERQDSGMQVIAHYPSVINGVVLSDKHYLAPNPWGPVIEGQDILASAVREVYAEAAGYEVIFMDDWHTHHTSGGEIHCGTNVWRNADDQWWR